MGFFADDLKEAKLVSVLPDYEVPTQMSIYAIHPPGQFISPTAKAFVKLVDGNLSSLELQPPSACGVYDECVAESITLVDFRRAHSPKAGQFLTRTTVTAGRVPTDPAFSRLASMLGIIYNCN